MVFVEVGKNKKGLLRNPQPLSFTSPHILDHLIIILGQLSGVKRRKVNCPFAIWTVPKVLFQLFLPSILHSFRKKKWEWGSQSKDYRYNSRTGPWPLSCLARTNSLICDNWQEITTSRKFCNWGIHLKLQKSYLKFLLYCKPKRHNKARDESWCSGRFCMTFNKTCFNG
jgi:hypothetical protein